MKDKVIIYGCGNVYLNTSYFLHNKYKIVGLFDKNVKRVFDEFDVLPVEKLADFEFDYVICTVKNPELRKEIATEIHKIIPGAIIKYNLGFTADEVFNYDSNFFRTDLSKEEKMRLFKDNVDNVQIETTSSCNRKCWFCPNVDKNNLRYGMDNTLLSKENFKKIIDELATINYDKKFSVTMLQEPLMDPYITERYSYVKEKCPDTLSTLTTNGDYLTLDLFNELRIKGGVKYFCISIYCDGNSNENYSIEKAEFKVNKMAEKLSLKSYRYFSDDTQVWADYYAGDNCFVRIFCSNHRIKGNVIDKFNLNVYQRKYNCIIPFTQFVVQYNCKVVACCMFQPYKENEQMILGDTSKESIFDIFADEKAHEFRKKVTFNTKDTKFCRSCSFYDNYLQGKII